MTGRVISQRIQKRKEGKNFAYLTIDDYYDVLKLIILVPSALFQEHENNLSSIEGKSIGVMGVVKYNDFFKTNIIRAYELEIPTGYYIERKPV